MKHFNPCSNTKSSCQWHNFHSSSLPSRWWSHYLKIPSWKRREWVKEAAEAAVDWSPNRFRLIPRTAEWVSCVSGMTMAPWLQECQWPSVVPISCCYLEASTLIGNRIRWGMCHFRRWYICLCHFVDLEAHIMIIIWEDKHDLGQVLGRLQNVYEIVPLITFSLSTAKIKCPISS